MSQQYLRVRVFSDVSLSDSSNGGFTVTHADKLVVPCIDGNINEEDVEEEGLIILTLQSTNKPQVYYYFEHRVDGEWTMSGGNFVYSSDSRFRSGYGSYPIAVHDRREPMNDILLT